MAAGGGLPRAKPCWQLSPRDAGMDLLESGVDDGSRVSTWSPATRGSFCLDDVLDPAPLLFAQRLKLERAAATELAYADALVSLAVDTLRLDDASGDLAFGAPDS